MFLYSWFGFVFPLIVFRTQMNFLVVIDADRMLWLAYRAAHVGVLQRLWVHASCAWQEPCAVRSGSKDIRGVPMVAGGTYLKTRRGVAQWIHWVHSLTDVFRKEVSLRWVSYLNRLYIDRKQEILFHYSFYDIPDDWLELVYYEFYPNELGHAYTLLGILTLYLWNSTGLVLNRSTVAM
jgi:hypothetical protein